MEFLSQNLPTVVAGLILAAIVAAAVTKMVRDKRRHKSSCGCGCANCPHACSSHQDS